MILVYHKFIVDVHNLQDLKRKNGFKLGDNSLFSRVLLSFKLIVYLKLHATWS
jgi:hypothetical protein